MPFLSDSTYTQDEIDALLLLHLLKTGGTMSGNIDMDGNDLENVDEAQIAQLKNIGSALSANAMPIYNSSGALTGYLVCTADIVLFGSDANTYLVIGPNGVGCVYGYPTATARINCNSSGISTKDDLIPDVTDTDDIGTSSKKYNEGYFKTAVHVATAPSAIDHLTRKDYVDTEIKKRWHFNTVLCGDDKAYCKSNIVAGRVVGYLSVPGTDTIIAPLKINAVLWHKDAGKKSKMVLYDPTTTLTVATIEATSQVPIQGGVTPTNWPTAKRMLEIQLHSPDGNEARIGAIGGV